MIHLKANYDTFSGELRYYSKRIMIHFRTGMNASQNGITLLLFVYNREGQSRLDLNAI